VSPKDVGDVKAEVDLFPPILHVLLLLRTLDHHQEEEIHIVVHLKNDVDHDPILPPPPDHDPTHVLRLKNVMITPVIHPKESDNVAVVTRALYHLHLLPLHEVNAPLLQGNKKEERDKRDLFQDL